jgi:hypothetical protein
MEKFTGTVRDIEDNVMEENIDIWLAETGTDFQKEYRGHFESSAFFLQSTINQPIRYFLHLEDGRKAAFLVTEAASGDVHFKITGPLE